MELIITRVSNDAELIGIQELQRDNLRNMIGEEEAHKEGFVTAEYSMELLKPCMILVLLWLQRMGKKWLVMH